jgi:hypothetical protein
VETPPPLCEAHWERLGRRVAATRFVAASAFCQNCFSGRPISAHEFLGESLKVAPRRRHRRWVLKRTDRERKKIFALLERRGHRGITSAELRALTKHPKHRLRELRARGFSIRSVGRGWRGASFRLLA